MALFNRDNARRTEFDREALPHLSAMYGAAMRLCRNEDEAADLVQEAMLRAFRFWGTFHAGTNCKAWLFRILTNVFRNRYREREREHAILSQAEASEANLGRFTGTNADVESTVIGRMVSREVEAALKALPADFRLAVILADIEDFSYKELADIMDCPAGTVMSRLHRGRKLLKEMLADYAAEQGIGQAHGDDTEAGAPASAPIPLDAYRKRRDGGAA